MIRYNLENIYKGETWKVQYDLILSNINNALLSENIKVIQDNEEMNKIKDYRNLNEALKRSKWQTNELEISRIAASYLLGIDKGENAFEVERKLRENLNKISSDITDINIPDHIGEAIQWVCS